MRLLSVTVQQKKAKYQLAHFFYSQVLGLPHQTEVDDTHTRWFTHPAMLVSEMVDPTALQQPHGGFTGIQLNVYPMRRVHRIVNDVRKLGYKLPDARLAGDVLVATVQDPTANAIMIVGHRERPDEPLTNQAIAAVSVFVSSLARARGFYESVLGLPFASAPHPGMMVFGEPGATSVMLYQAQRGLPETPVGRLTPYTFVTDDLAEAVAVIERSEGTIVERSNNAETGELERVSFKDPERNTFVVVSEAVANMPEPLPLEPIPDADEAPEPMDRGAALELDDAPAAHAKKTIDEDDIGGFFRDLELD